MQNNLVPGAKISPLYDKLMVRLDVTKYTTASGLYLSENAHPEKIKTGTVIEVGEGRLLKNGTILPLVVKPGDKIIFNEYVGTRIKIPNPETGKDVIFIFIKEDDIWATFEGDIESIRENLDRAR